MINTLIFKPIFNVLTFLYAILPGHNLGGAIILFTIIARMALWPLVKKQLHHARAMRELQPQLKQIKKDAAGDRQKEYAMSMALYKEKETSPMAPILILIVQLPIILGLYAALNKIIKHPESIVTNSYHFIQQMPAIQALANGTAHLDSTLFGVIDLTKPALGPEGMQLGALLIVIGASVMQYFQTKQLSVAGTTDRKLKDIFKDTASGKKVEQSEVSASIQKGTRYLFPVILLFVTINIPSGLALYIFVSGLVAYLQQAYILRKDQAELSSTVDSIAMDPIKTEKPKKVVSKVTKSKKPTPKSKKKGKR